jgi:hypothetical protein
LQDPKVWKLINSLPKPKHETLEKEAAIKAIKDADLSTSSVSVVKNEALGIAQDAPVVVNSAEYANQALPFYAIREANFDSAAPSLACIPRTASLLVQRHTRSSLVSNRVYSYTSRELATSSRNCRRVYDTNKYDRYRFVLSECGQSPLAYQLFAPPTMSS